MALVKLQDDKSAKTEAREVFDDIRKTRNTDYVNNIWRALAVHPPMLKRFWGYMKEVIVKESKLDALTKEYIYLAVSSTNNCEIHRKSSGCAGGLPKFDSSGNVGKGADSCAIFRELSGWEFG